MAKEMAFFIVQIQHILKAVISLKPHCFEPVSLPVFTYVVRAAHRSTPPVPTDPFSLL
jgi:hypothetical protein